MRHVHPDEYVVFDEQEFRRVHGGILFSFGCAPTNLKNAQAISAQLRPDVALATRRLG